MGLAEAESALNLLVVTADDFGLAAEVNEAVEAAHRYGVLSAASLMVNGPAAADAVSKARALRSLAVGLHLTLVDGEPVLPPRRIPDLVDSGGRLRSDLVQISLAIAFRPEARRQLRAEIEAQFEAYRRTGLPLAHVDVHKHFHLHPFVAREIIDVGRSFGMRSLRIPREPHGVLRQIERKAFYAESGFIGAWAELARVQARSAGLSTPDAVFGRHWSGSFTSEKLVAVLRTLPLGFNEIYCHPATSDGFSGSASGYRYREELDALLAGETLSALRASGFRLGSYRDA